MDGAALDTELNARRKAYTAARSDATTTRTLAEKVADRADRARELRPVLLVLPRGRRAVLGRRADRRRRRERPPRRGRRAAGARRDRGRRARAARLGGQRPHHAASSSASRSGVSPTPSTSSACSSVAATVSSSGRNVRPAATARDASTSRKRRHSSLRVSTQSGSSIHSPTSCAGEERVVDLDGAGRRAGDPPGGVDHRPHRRRPRDVERPGVALLGGTDDPGGEVADVDDLHRPPRGPGDEDVAAAGDPVGPVREAAGRVVRADDQPRPHARSPAPGTRVSTASSQSALSAP